jgi:hypothetical protein
MSVLSVLFVFRFLRTTIRIAIAINSSSALTPTPIPIPILAGLLKEEVDVSLAISMFLGVDVGISVDEDNVVGLLVNGVVRAGERKGPGDAMSPSTAIWPLRMALFHSVVCVGMGFGNMEGSDLSRPVARQLYSTRNYKLMFR